MSTERMEYRVVSDEGVLGERVRGGTILDVETAHLWIRRCRADGCLNPRIQSSTVTRTPWTDLEEE